MGNFLLWGAIAVPITSLVLLAGRPSNLSFVQNRGFLTEGNIEVSDFFLIKIAHVHRAEIDLQGPEGRVQEPELDLRYVGALWNWFRLPW